MGIRFNKLKNATKELSEEIMERKIEDLKDIQIVMTNEMKDLAIALLTIKQTLDDDTLTFKERKLFQKEFDELLYKFKEEFQAHNQIQVQIVRAYLSGK